MKLPFLGFVNLSRAAVEVGADYGGVCSVKNCPFSSEFPAEKRGRKWGMKRNEKWKRRNRSKRWERRERRNRRKES